MEVKMLGAIAGDIIGSVYEFANTKSMEFDLFTPWTKFTDDSVMTLAVAKWLVEDSVHTIHYLLYCMQELGNLYPQAGYGGNFMTWLREDDPQPNSRRQVLGLEAAITQILSPRLYKLSENTKQNAKKFKIFSYQPIIPRKKRLAA